MKRSPRRGPSTDHHLLCPARAISWHPLRRESGSFADQDLADRHSDLLSSLDEWLHTLRTLLLDPSGPAALAQLLRYIALVTDDLQLEVFVTSSGRSPRRSREPS